MTDQRRRRDGRSNTPPMGIWARESTSSVRNNSISSSRGTLDVYHRARVVVVFCFRIPYGFQWWSDRSLSTRGKIATGWTKREFILFSIVPPLLRFERVKWINYLRETGVRGEFEVTPLFWQLSCSVKQVLHVLLVIKCFWTFWDLSRGCSVPSEPRPKVICVVDYLWNIWQTYTN